MPGNYLHRAQSSRISISHAQSNELFQFTITLHSFLWALCIKPSQYDGVHTWPLSSQILQFHSSRKVHFPLHCSFALSVSKLQIVHSSFCGIHPSISTTSGHPSYLLVSLLFLICCKEKAISIVRCKYSYCCTETQDFLTYKKQYFYLCWVVQILMSCYIFPKAKIYEKEKFQSKEKQKAV